MYIIFLDISIKYNPVFHILALVDLCNKINNIDLFLFYYFETLGKATNVHPVLSCLYLEYVSNNCSHFPVLAKRVMQYQPYEYDDGV